MRLLITGASGFIGRHVVDAALAAGHEVVAATRSGVVPRVGGPGNRGSLEVLGSLSLADRDRLASAVRSARPDAVIHLAGFANVGWSHASPAEAIEVNTVGAAALLTAVGLRAPDARVVLASSSEVYARSADPLTEAAPLSPESPYGSSKRWMEETADYFRARHGLSIGVARSFAHCGPGQAPAFALSNFARQLAEARLAGLSEAVIKTGNKATVRDYSDVEDASRAYLALATAGAGPGVDGPFNVGSGVGRTTASIVSALATAAGIDVDHQEDPELVRPGENPRLVADISAIGSALGWRPEVPFDQTAADTVSWWTQTLERDPTQGSGIYG